jgi:peroxiredoxin
MGMGVLVALLAGLSGFLLSLILTTGQEGTAKPPKVGEALIGQVRPEFTLADLKGAPRKVSEWDGKVLIVNFWATWCPPCRKEIPSFIRLQGKYGDRGVQFVGIALDEPSSVQSFTQAMGINYPILIGDSGTITRHYGDHLGVLPYTVIIDRSRKIAFVRLGELSPEEAEAAIQGLIRFSR